MERVQITVGGRPYELACNRGEEQRIIDLARYVDHRVSELANGGGRGDDVRLLVMTCLVLADELSDVLGLLEASQARSDDSTLAPVVSADGEALIADLNGLAERIEAVAASLERP